LLAKPTGPRCLPTHGENRTLNPSASIAKTSDANPPIANESAALAGDDSKSNRQPATLNGTGGRLRFYVKEHNCRLPHSAFRGQTPDEMYFGKGGDIPETLEALRQKARKERIETNRKRTCRACERPVAIAS
jgi:hypothetical protein